MKTKLLAAAAALSVSVGSAYANESGSQAGGYVYPDYPPAAAAQNGQGIGAYMTNSSHGTWLFPPNQDQGNGS
jgi:hypothetical protein